MPYPRTATLVIGKQKLAGCAGEAASLLHGDWQVWTIGGNAVVPQSAPTLSFDPDGSIHGNASCNRFFGRFVLTGESLSISGTGTSRMMCEQPVMDQEQNLLKALSSVHRFEAVSKDEIRFLGGDDQALFVVRR